MLQWQLSFNSHMDQDLLGRLLLVGSGSDSEAPETLRICICNTFLENVGGASLRMLL